jgi:hypothetical protein
MYYYLLNSLLLEGEVGQNGPDNFHMPFVIG